LSVSRLRTRPDESGRPGSITKAGYAKLQAEAEQLWSVERPRLVKSVAEAAAEGDRSENAEYIYGKRKLAEIDRRLAFLGRRLEVLTIAETAAPADGRVAFGAYITLEDEDAQVVRYRIVGSDESDASAGLISESSPLGRAALGRRVGDEIEFSRPKGDAIFTLLEISYDAGD
jgi:transcription elongation factor GreB